MGLSKEYRRAMNGRIRERERVRAVSLIRSLEALSRVNDAFRSDEITPSFILQ